MPQNDLLVDVLRRDLGILKMTLADFTDAELMERPVPTANSGMWQLGHLVASEASLVNGCAGRTVIELPAGFAERYSKETASKNDAPNLGTKAALLAQYDKVREKTCQWVEGLTPTDLAKPGPEMLRDVCPTVGHVVHLFPAHGGMHIGQIQVLRRKLGKPRLM